MAKTPDEDNVTIHPPAEEGDSLGDLSITAQIGAGALRIPDYMPINVVVNINSVEFPDYGHSAIETEERHVNGMRDRFLGDGYLSSAGTIKITVTDTRLLENPEGFLESGRRLHLSSNESSVGKERKFSCRHKP